MWKLPVSVSVCVSVRLLVSVCLCMNLNRYQVGQAYIAHYDYFPANSQDGGHKWDPQNKGSNRFATVRWGVRVCCRLCVSSY